ncbi:MAG TPA: hypothetical protein VEL31_10010 [Ktedonobacteraceae bacterium]|nr:hypothetical protein [Ktedonobacteraceae bacterium]
MRDGRAFITLHGLIASQHTLWEDGRVQALPYRGAHGNGWVELPAQRFWTGNLYCCTHNRQWQAPWLKEEFPSF